MTIQIIKGENGVTVNGDAELLKKLPEGFDASTVDLTGVRIDAQVISVAYDQATSKGLDAIKRYAALKQAFLHQQELIRIEENKPKEKHEPAINSQSIKAVDAQ